MREIIISQEEKVKRILKLKKLDKIKKKKYRKIYQEKKDFIIEYKPKKE